MIRQTNHPRSYGSCANTLRIKNLQRKVAKNAKGRKEFDEAYDPFWRAFVLHGGNSEFKQQNRMEISTLKQAEKTYWGYWLTRKISSIIFMLWGVSYLVFAYWIVCEKSSDSQRTDLWRWSSFAILLTITVVAFTAAYIVVYWKCPGCGKRGQIACGVSKWGFSMKPRQPTILEKQTYE